jgi:hypothetical protein
MMEPEQLSLFLKMTMSILTILMLLPLSKEAYVQSVRIIASGIPVRL